MSEANPTFQSEPMTIVDMGVQRGKKIDQLAQGQGKLFSEVTNAVSRLKHQGTIPRDAHVLVVVVKKKRKKSPLRKLALPCF